MGTKKSTTGGQHSFAEVPRAEIQRSTFDRSNGLKTAFDSGELVPIFLDEGLPGDTMSLKMDAFGRLSTPITPFMDNVYVDTFFFSVPMRLVWDNWQKFNGEQTNPGDSTDFLVPTVTSTAALHTIGSLFDYLGLPVLTDGIEYSSLPLRACNLIWNEWFRSQDLQDSLPVPKDDGPDTLSDFKIQNRGKRHDYFSSCLPSPQKGPAVELPLGGTAPVTMDNQVINTFGTGSGIPQLNVQATVGSMSQSDLGGSITAMTHGSGLQGELSWQNPNMGIQLNGATGVADLSTATAATINSIRQAFQIQKLLERDARGGTRYIETLKNHFGVTSPDSRVQRPEYLGGGTSRINVNAVAQTTPTGIVPDVTPQGNLAAFATVNISGHGFTTSFVEHTIVIGFACVRADLSYQQGLDKMWSRKRRFDFYWPALAHLGEEAVLNKEIYAKGDANDDLVFGFQERYASYRYKPSKITGVMRSDAPQSTDIWHIAQDFQTLPVLNAEFIIENPPLDRVLAITDEPQILFDAYFTYKCTRPMPVYSVPGLVDHF